MSGLLDLNKNQNNDACVIQMGDLYSLSQGLLSGLRP